MAKPKATQISCLESEKIGFSEGQGWQLASRNFDDIFDKNSSPLQY